MKTLDVKPPVLLQVEDFAEFLIDFSVTMRPHTCFVQSKQGMHPCSKKVGVKFCFDEAQKSCHGALHGFFKEHGRLERCVSLYFHDMQLEFFSESEVGQLYEIDYSSAVAFYDLVSNG